MSQTVLLIGTRKGLWVARSDGDRREWRMDPPQLLMENVSAVGVDPRGPGDGPRLYAGSTSWVYGTRVLVSDDLGASFTAGPVDAIRFPERTEATLAAVWQLTPGIGVGEVWAGTEPSALFHSTDGGGSFTLVDGLWDHPHRPTWAPGGGGQAVHTVLPHPTDPDDVLVAMSTGGVYRTGDGGVSWQARSSGIRADFLPGEEPPDHGQCVHKAVRNPADPAQLFAQNHGGVFRSDDGGVHWTDISAGLPADFGFSVLAHPHRPGTVFVLPLVADVERLPPGGQLAVWRSDDAGRTWREQIDGLPTDPVWSAVMRDAACTDTADPAGIYLGTRSGSVFAGTDVGGELTFTTVARDLPDVLSLRALVIS
ncbi:hypothetical protein JL107_14915 [Nakamurella flavida]|uniref:Exo-alpha-sialidase n=1 Tax=Nakamurella flavida TaxID=363630 RepID=A0A938YHF0_9ACTN|nr:hypothetical protein [Nakamurella flavida]MBM9477741.1 hypothetical protein [Nakamurella flavida]MDP9779293.1 photosystem II stability/assembly factor-like uncharacterized protein [Nakamurella flavida]